MRDGRLPRNRKGSGVFLLENLIKDKIGLSFLSVLQLVIVENVFEINKGE